MNSFLLFGTGILLWPILEYLLHRFSGHDLKFPAIFYKEHQAHHRMRDYFSPAWKKVLASVVFLAILTGINLIWLPFVASVIFSGGFIFMYLVYEITHFCFHAFAPRTKLGLQLRKHHFSHHYISPRHNHGVTTTFADHLFGTWKEVDQVPIPSAMAMVWLLDAQNQVKPQYRTHFRIS